MTDIETKPQVRVYAWRSPLVESGPYEFQVELLDGDGCDLLRLTTSGARYATVCEAHTAGMRWAYSHGYRIAYY